MNPTPPFVDVRQVRRNAARAARNYADYEAAAVLPREIAGRMLERLDYVKIEPQRVLDLGCGPGATLAALGERYPRAQVIGADFSEPMLRASLAPRSRLRWLMPFLRGAKSALVAADAAALPFAAGSQGLVWSNLLLHWLADPQPALREMHRVLEVDGLLMFSTLGPDSLKELRACFPDGAARSLRFIDLHDYGDMLVECGFADPVMDAERLTVTYPSFDALVDELRRSGANNGHFDRPRGLTGRGAWAAARANYEALRQDGRLPVTLEVVYGHAWKVAPKKTADGAAIVRFDPKQRLR